jgi:hypothetical protein
VREHSFSLQKWYLDCVEESGDLAVVYCVEFSWRGLSVHLNSVLTKDKNGVRTRSSNSRYQIDANDLRISIDLPKLGASGLWEAIRPRYERLVYENEGGSLTWNCLQPGSCVHLHMPHRELKGLGYAEHVSLSIPPWALPLRELRWGRFISSCTALAWVDWQGPYCTRFAVRDGRETSLLAIADDEIAMPDATLRIEPGISLRSGPLASTILPGLPMLQKVLPRSLLNVEEHKWCSRGTVTGPNDASDGWVIHEVVHWNA